VMSGRHGSLTSMPLAQEWFVFALVLTARDSKKLLNG